jgi:proline dehydrogenase
VILARRLARRLAFGLATSDRMERIVLDLTPLRAVAFRQARRYVAGVDERSALDAVAALERQGLSASVDLFGENVSDVADAEIETDRYLALASALADYPGTYLSLDCSHVGLDRDPDGCFERVARIAAALPAGSRLQLGAEESPRAGPTLAIARRARGDGLPIMATVQANLRRSREDVESLAAAGIPIRLVKGAYVEPEQIAHRWGSETDRAYVELAERLVRLGADHALATHDPAILAHLLGRSDHATVEFLFGVREDAALGLAAAGHHVRVYVPYGHRWFRYYARRVAESIGA